MGSLSESERYRIAGRARTLQERLETEGDRAWIVEDVDRALAEWEAEVADGDPERFRERLRYEGVDPEECRRRMEANGWPEDEPLPEWVGRLEDLVEFVHDREIEEDVPNTDEIAFAHVLEPIVEYADRSTAPVDDDRVPESARQGFVDWLWVRLDRLLSRALFIEFKTHVAQEDESLVFDDDPDIPPGSTEYYDEFVRSLLNGGLTSFFREYSFLGRLLVTIVDDWIDRHDTFFERLLTDWEAIEGQFSPSGGFETVTAVESTGDPHQGGRTVFEVTFDSTVTVAYKPRASGLVSGFYDFLEWINDTGSLPELPTIDVLVRDGYGWMEWVEPGPCSTEDQVRQYYRRAGMFICLFYAFDATDMHLINVLAAGEHPVPIDLETLSQPEVGADYREIDDRFTVAKDTVARTGAVPLHSENDEVGVTGGFGDPELNLDFDVQVFEHVNTDRMDIRTTARPPIRGQNLPTYDGETISPDDYTDAIVDGFQEMYRFVLDNREAILADDGPVQRLTDLEGRVRVLYRSTARYSTLKQAMTSASNLRTGLHPGIELETLAQILVAGDVDPAVRNVCRTEQETLCRFNLPRFSAKVDSTDLYSLEEVVVEDFFRKPPIEHVRDRIRSFSESDLQEQTTYVRWGYGGYRNAHTSPERAAPETSSEHAASETSSERAAPDRSSERAPPETSSERAAPETAPTVSEDYEKTVERAVRGILDRIESSARTWNDSPTWVRREVGPEGGLHIREIPNGLYDGRVGIAVFVAAVARTFEDERARSFASEIASPLCSAIDDDEPLPEEAIGAGAGLGSIVYGLTKLGQLLDDDQYVDRARQVARRITPNRIHADRQYDILYGSAGAVVALTDLYETTGDEDLLDRATVAGEHLLAERTGHDGVDVWCPSGLDRPLCGFSHGIAGIAYPLYRLGDATGESRFRDAAVRSLEYERHHYDEQTHNWADLRPGSPTDRMDAWCHGRTGIGLARLGMDEIDGDGTIRDEIEQALTGIDPGHVPAADHVCCGTFGRVEFLCRAGRSLDDDRLRRAARGLASASIERSDDGFSVQWQTAQWQNPSFFDGEAGVGYTLLRTIDPSLPCVLLWK